jgi:hypothetical protein
MLHGIIAAYPGTQDNECLQHYVFLYFPSAEGGIPYHGEEDDGGEQAVEQQDRKHGIASQGLFLEYVIETQQGGADKGKQYPHILFFFIL